MMKKIATKFGKIPVVGAVEYFKSGEVKACIPAEGWAVKTSVGVVEAQHTADDLRRRTVSSVMFHETGELKSLALETQTIVSTPLGGIPAEMLTFYPGGALKRIFPLNGKLSGYWSQDDEAGLAEPLKLQTPVGEIESKIINIQFFESGKVRSITLWPGETVPTPTPVGMLEARIGVSFYENGALRSLEPAAPSDIPTPAGQVSVYDPDAVGVNGDMNSLMFGKDGALRKLSTTQTCIFIHGANPTGETSRAYCPGSRESVCGMGEREAVPMAVEFYPEHIAIRISEAEPPALAAIAGNRITTAPHRPHGIHMLLAAPPLTCSI